MATCLQISRQSERGQSWPRFLEEAQLRDGGTRRTSGAACPLPPREGVVHGHGSGRVPRTSVLRHCREGDELPENGRGRKTWVSPFFRETNTNNEIWGKRVFLHLSRSNGSIFGRGSVSVSDRKSENPVRAAGPSSRGPPPTSAGR